MSEKITFLHAQWLWLILGIALLLGLVFVWKEWKSGKKRLFLKSIIAFLALTALALLALQPLVLRTETAGMGVILTPNYEKAQLDSLQQQYKGMPVLTYNAGKPLLNRIDTLKTVWLLGEGIQPFDLWQLDHTAANYLGSNLPKGIIRLNYKAENVTGNLLVINGLYHQGENGNKLLLQDPAGNALDSISLKAEKEQNFQLQTELKTVGNYVFWLVEKDSLGKVISSDPLPVQIAEKKRLKILVLNGFPTFETKYLKNFLAESGHELMVRSQVSKGRYVFEYFNRERTPIGTLSAKSLEALDLLILDTYALKSLTRTERIVLEKAIREVGLGVWIQADAGFFNAQGSLTSFDFYRDKNTAIRLDAWPKLTLSKHPYVFKEGFLIQPIYQANGKLISAYQRLGTGRVGTSVIENTYPWLLDDHATAYQELWAEILNTISKKEIPVATWEAPAIVFKDAPFQFKIRTLVNEPTVTGHFEIPLRQEVAIPNIWIGTLHPQETGWNQLTLKQDTTAVYSYYVTDTSHWKALTAAETIAANQNYFKQTHATGAKNKTWKPLKPWWFFMIFLVCMGYLWLEPKVYE